MQHLQYQRYLECCISDIGDGNAEAGTDANEAGTDTNVAGTDANEITLSGTLTF
jgi:hypothetical protein